MRCAGRNRKEPGFDRRNSKKSWLFANGRVVKPAAGAHTLVMNTQMHSNSVKLLAERVPDVRSVAAVVLLHQAEDRSEALDTIEEIHLRAETMTSLLKGILDYQPATHWGINE